MVSSSVQALAAGYYYFHFVQYENNVMQFNVQLSASNVERMPTKKCEQWIWEQISENPPIKIFTGDHTSSCPET